MADEHIGKEILICTDEGKFYGTIHSIDAQNRKLILQKVSTSMGVKMRGLHIFFTNEIRDLQLLEKGNIEDEQSTSQAEEDTSTANEIDDEEAIPVVTTKDPSDEGSRLISRQPMAPNKLLAGDEDSMTNSREEELIDPPDVVFIGGLGEKFEEAIGNINNQRVVGLSAEGDKISRSGVLCLLTVGCRRFTYIFDIYSMGEEAFSAGLREFLENCDILKVTHDCRLLSDCLFHKYDIKMKNIFDTQVADIIIFKQKRGVLPRDVNGLEACLYEYLRLHPSKCTFSSVIFKSIKDDSNIWTRRPIPTDLLNAAAEKALYLRELRIVQMENMLAEFVYGVDVYLEIFRDSNVDYSKSLPKTKKVPDPFYRLKNVTERRWRSYGKRDKKVDSVGNVLPGGHKGTINNPEETVGWTEGKMFADRYSEIHGKILERDDLDAHSKYPEVSDGQSIDTSTAPWRSKGFVATKNASNEIMLKYEASVMESAKKDNQPHSNGKAVGRLEKSSSPFRDGTDQDGPRQVSPDLRRNHASSVFYSKNRNEVSPKSDSNGTINNLRGKQYDEFSPKSSLEYRMAKDWFDCDSPASDRSIASSFGSDSSFSSTHAQSFTKQSHYDEEFPSLVDSSLDSSPSNKSAAHSPGTPRKVGSDAINAGNAENGLSGVHKCSTKPRPMGRAKTREYFAATRSPLIGSSLSNDQGRVSVGEKNSHRFPSDTDLLQTKPIIKSEQIRPVSGKAMKIQKITQK